MTSPPATSEQTPTPRAANIAGPLRLLLLALTGIVFLIGGVAIGLILQRMELASGHTGQTQDSSPQSEGAHADHAHHAEPEQHGGEEAPLKEHPDSVSEQPSSPPVGQHQIAHTEGASRKAAVPVEAISSSATPFSSLPELPTGNPGEQLAQADKLMMIGNYQGAQEACQLLVSQSATFQPAEVRLRLGLCAEALGDYRQAQAEYRAVVELHPALELRDAALLGQARVWSLAGRNEQASATLFHAILSGTRQSSELTGGQILHQLAVLLAQRVSAVSKAPGQLGEDYLDESMVSPTLKIEPFQVIGELAGLPLTPPEKEEVLISDISIVERFSQAPEEIYLKVRSERMTALELIRRVANRTGLTVRITEDARLRLQEHTVQPDCLKIPLAVVFDAILEPFDTIWRVENETLLIQLARHANATEITQYRLQSARRMLRFACRSAPHHRWAAASSLELARLTARSGTLEDASQYLSKMLEEFPRSEFEPIGWFNLGKIDLRRGEFESALKAFHRAADLLMGHPLEALSYLYAGRIEMENDNPREAIPALTRALVLAEGSKHEPMAALQLASAYLMLEHFQRANEILLEHKSALIGSAQQDQAAFLASLIQYRATKDQREKFRAGTSLLGSLTNLDSTQCFGGQWPWLAASAYHEFGMAQQEITILSAILESPYAYPLQNRARLMLLEDAPERLTQLTPALMQVSPFGSPPALHFKTRLKEAETAFHQGNAELALKMSRDLAEHSKISEDDRRAALRLMGRIYQSQGQHQFAVRCFSGIVPDTNSSQVPPTAALPIPSQGVQ